MPSKSKKQQRLMGMIYRCKETGNCPPGIKEKAEKMSLQDAKDFAKTKHKGLPNKVKKKKGFDMIEKLIKLANYLDKKGFIKEANYIDETLEMYNKECDHPDWNLACVNNDDSKLKVSEMGDFSNLDDTDITPGEAFGAGYAVAEHDNKMHHSKSYMAKPQLARIEEAARESYIMLEDGEGISDWMESHIAQAEQLITSVHQKLKHKKHKYMVQKI